MCSASPMTRTASTSIPISRPDEKAYTATSSQCDTLNRRSESAHRRASARLPRSPYSSTDSGRQPRPVQLAQSRTRIDEAAAVAIEIKTTRSLSLRLREPRCRHLTGLDSKPFTMRGQIRRSLQNVSGRANWSRTTPGHRIDKSDWMRSRHLSHREPNGLGVQDVLTKSRLREGLRCQVRCLPRRVRWHDVRRRPVP